MTWERIARRILVGVGLVLGVAGCPPEPPDLPDASIGGSAPAGGATTGGRATGGAATGGSAAGGAPSVPVCHTVASLPTMGSPCPIEGESQDGESRCDANGNQCVCARGVWYCNTNCASSHPTEPTPTSACNRGEACSYPSGVNCACVTGSWWCMGGSGCPARAPMTAEPCNGSSNIECSYPDASPDYPLACICTANVDASTGSTWTCLIPTHCPTTQPAYDPNEPCTGYAVCSYGSTLCRCLQNGNGSPWVCGIGYFLPLMGSPSEPPGI